MKFQWFVYTISIWVVGCLITVTAVENQLKANFEGTNEIPLIDDTSLRFREIQNKILDLVGNSSSNMYTVTDMLEFLNTDKGPELGKLLFKGITLGMRQNNPGQLAKEFWGEFQERLNPTLFEAFEDYRDFMKGVDISTLPLVWDQLFKKDELGNSLASLPLGQLVDMLQPTASKYGIDIRSMMNSLMGKGDNNVRDLLFSALGNTDFSSVMGQFINATANALQPSETSANSNQKPSKKSKADKTIRLFRPLVASLLKENEIDLDADAVLQVLSPIFKTDIISQASPWIAMLASQGGKGGLGSIIANAMGAMGGAGEGFNQQQIGGLLGGLGALMAAGDNNKMDMSSLLNMASMFMAKPSKKKKNAKSKSNKSKENNDFDFGPLMNIAGQLIGDNINLDSILNMAASGLKPQKKKASTGTKVPPAKANQANMQKNKNKSKNILDLIKPILKSMQSDKKSNEKIKNAIDLGTAIIYSRISSMGSIDQIMPLLMSYLEGSEALNAKGVNLKTLASSFTEAFSKADWAEFLVSLENKDFRQMLIRNIAPNAADVLVLMATKESQEKIYDAVVPRVQSFMAAYGLIGITLENFPERLAPIMGLMGKSWNLPFNPTTVLVPLKVYLRGLKSWTLLGRDMVKELDTSQAEKIVYRILEEDLFEPALDVLQRVRTTPDPYCLPQRLCQANSDLPEDSLKAAVSRTVSLVSAYTPVLSTPDANLLLHTINAIAGTTDDCQDVFPGDCEPTDEEDEDEDRDLEMDLQYEHQEL